MFKNLSESEKKVLLIWIIIGIILLIITALIQVKVIVLGGDSKREKNGYTLVTDKDRYYTVYNALLKYYDFINLDNKSSVVNILSDDYKKKNKINEDNVDSYIDFYDFDVSYESGIMCTRVENDNITSYVVKGKEKYKNQSKIIKDKYYKVELDSLNFTYSVDVLDLKEYKENCYE